MNDRPKKKPPAVSMAETHEAIMKGFRDEAELLAKLPKKFDISKGEGVIEVPYELEESE